LSTILDLYIGGDTAKTKFLKPAIWRRSTEFLRRVADGYLDGDGALDKENDRWRLGFCANDKLTESLRTLGARTGARVHLKPSKSRDQTGKRHPIRRGEWRWQTTDRSLPPGELLGIERRPDAEEYFHITIDDPAGIWTLASGLQTYNSKCNPNYGISIYPESIQAEARRAQVMASAQGTFLTKHCNVWISADSAWLPAGAWEKCADRELDIEDFTGQPCYLGIDLALRSDIAALMTVFPPHGEREYWAVFGRYFLPEQTVNRSENQHYQGWEATGRLTATPGAITDFDFIIAAIADHAERFQIIEITIDPYDAGPLIATLEREGLPKPIEVRQSAANMSPAMIELEGIVIGGTIRHDGDPVLAWMFANVNCRRSSDDLLFPKKAGEEKKIDGVTATLMCIHRALKAPAIAEGRGAWVISMEDE
jgi:hypothetical protein